MRLDAHFDMLPERAFRRVGGPMGRLATLEGKGGGSAPSPDPNIGIAQREMSQISREYLESWKTEIWPEMQRASKVQEERADEQFALDTTVQRKQMAIADEQYGRYQDVYRPLQDDIVQDANEYDTEGNFQQQAALAMGDVRDQFEQGRQNNAMQLRSFGINPNSGRYQGMQNANNVMESATAAAAATKARTAAEQLGWAKKMDAIGMGSGVFGNQATSTQLGLAAGAAGLNAGQTTMGNLGAMGQSMGQANTGAAGIWGQVGQIGVGKYNADVSAYSAQQQANAGASAGLGSAIGMIGGAAMKYAFPATAALPTSDIRAKENIEVVGRLPSGLFIYEYEYKPEFKDKPTAGHGRYRGVMAHEVLQVIPDAVYATEDGYLAVDYSKVH